MLANKGLNFMQEPRLDYGVMVLLPIRAPFGEPGRDSMIQDGTHARAPPKPGLCWGGGGRYGL